jgi:hypothetical protein
MFQCIWGLFEIDVDGVNFKKGIIWFAVCVCFLAGPKEAFAGWTCGFAWDYTTGDGVVVRGFEGETPSAAFDILKGYEGVPYSRSDVCIGMNRNISRDLGLREGHPMSSERIDYDIWES